MNMRNPMETAQGPVHALSGENQRGPEASTVYGSRWAKTSSSGRPTSSLSHQETISLALESDEEDLPPVLSPQKKTDVNSNLQIKDKNNTDTEKSTLLQGADLEVRELMNGSAAKLTPSAVGKVIVKPTNKTKATEFTAKLMGVPVPDNSHLTRGWKEHPVVKMGREEVNNRFSEMPHGPESEKRLGIPQPPSAMKSQTVSAEETLTGAEMNKLPQALRTEIPQGAKIETLELKAKLPKAVEDESAGILWNAVRIYFK